MENDRVNAQGIRGKKKKKSKGEIIFLVCLLAFPILHFLVFYVGVNFNSLLLAFQKYDPNDATYGFMGFGNFFANFAKVFDNLGSETVLLTATKNSIVLYLFGLLVGTPLNILIAFCVYKKIPMENFFRVIIFLPSIISSIVFVLIFKHFVDYGIPAIWKLFGCENAPQLLFDERFTFNTLIFYGLWTGFGSGVILYSNAMTRIPDSVVEYGQLEGVKPLRELVSIVIPMIFPTLTTFLVTGIAGIFINQGAVYTFFGEHAYPHSYTLGYYMFVQVIGAKSSPANYPYAAAMGLVFTLFAAPITLLVKWGLEKLDPSVSY